MGRDRAHPFMDSRARAIAGYAKIESRPGRRSEGPGPGDIGPGEAGTNDPGSPGVSINIRRGPGGRP
jgi:hypothetical protein